MCSHRDKNFSATVKWQRPVREAVRLTWKSIQIIKTCEDVVGKSSQGRKENWF